MSGSGSVTTAGASEWVRTGAQYTAMQRVAMGLLLRGQLPCHLAIIMDGNRRFAEEHGLQKSQGHLKGFQKVGEVLEWCRDLGITEVTVYAFSIENFSRSQEEVAGLMQLAREKFAKLLAELDQLSAHGVCVRVVGNLDLLPADVRAMAARIMVATRSHDKAKLNVCFAYTSRDDMAHSVALAVEAVQSGLLRPGDVTPRLLDRCARTRLSPAPDLLIRTSGEARLSDFLLWQTQFTCVHFVKALWPDFSVWHLLWAVFSFQRNYSVMRSGLDALSAAEQESEDDPTDPPLARRQRLDRFDKFVCDRDEETLKRYLLHE